MIRTGDLKWNVGAMQSMVMLYFKYIQMEKVLWFIQLLILKGYKMRVEIDVPDGKSGNVSISTFHVSKEAEKMGAIRALFKGGRFVKEGVYKELRINGTLVMSNTNDEIRDLYPLESRAKGHILINGLGLGVALKMILVKPDVLQVTVIEKNPDVIKLVAPSYNDPRVTIIQADAFTWKPPKGVRYNCVWHDIWDDICSDNLKEMERLHRKYGRRAEWQGSWCKERCKYLKKQNY